MSTITNKLVTIWMLVALIISDSMIPVAYATGSTVFSPDLDISSREASQQSAKKRIPLTIEDTKGQDFAADEEVAIMINNPDNEAFTTEVFNAVGEKADVEIDTTTQGTQTEVSIAPTNQFKPGKYTISVTDRQGKTTKQDFTWGVLALNLDKDGYRPGETAAIAMAVLNDKGEMVCDAEVELVISNRPPNASLAESGELGIRDSLSTYNKKIKVNPGCTSYDFTLEPDYAASYVFAQSGIYDIHLIAKTKNGERSITSTVNVGKEKDFDIKRSSATRIYPPLTYPMNIEITANKDFNGTVTEVVPDSFTITSADTAESYDDMKTLYMNGNDPADALEKKIMSSGESLLEMPFNGTYQITQGFGHELTDHSLKDLYANFGIAGHDGIDFALPMGTPIFAVDEGTVVWSGPGDYGTQVIVQHSWGQSYYGHMSKTTVEKGFSVTKGSHIGYSGNTGESTGPHLHFGIKPTKADMENGYAGKLDPLVFLPKEMHLPSTKMLSFVEQQSVLAATDSAETDPTMPIPSLEPTQHAENKQAKELKETMQTASAAAFTISDEELAKKVAVGQPSHIERVKVIRWSISLKKGEQATLRYNYRTPQISPQFYTVGPLSFYSGDKITLEYKESRSWQIAADAVGVSWYNDGTAYGGYNWLYRKQITINDAQVPANQTNFPVMISLTSDANLSSSAQSDGDDILFTDSTGRTKLSHEIEKYSSGTLVAWVRVPTLNGSADTTLYMYYGNPSAANQQNAPNVWDSNFKAVYHTKETSNVTTIADSTSNGYTLTKRAAAGPAMTTSGKNGNALDFERSNQDYANSSALASAISSGSFSISVWFRPEVNMTSGTAEHHIINMGDLSGASDIVIYFIDNNLIFKLYNTSDVKNELSVPGTWNAGTWYHGYFVYDASAGMRMYVNGSLVDSDSFTNRGAYSSGTFDLGRKSSTVSANEWWDGIEDDIHVSSSARSANWVLTEYNNTNSPGTFYSVGSQETKIYSASNSQLMRHGNFFNSVGAEQPFLF